METEDEVILFHKSKEFLKFFNHRRSIRFHIHKDLQELHNKIIDLINKLEK